MKFRGYLIINGFNQPLYQDSFLLFPTKKEAMEYKKKMKKTWRKRKIVEAYITYE